MKKVTRLVAMMLMMVSFWCSSIIVKAENCEAGFIELDVQETTVLEGDNSHSYYSNLSNPSLGLCQFSIGIYENGVGITFVTRSTVEAEEIGIKDFVLQEKTLFGGWTDIPVKNYCDYDTDTHAGSVVYVRAVEGKTYRALCTHYAIIDGVEYTLDAETGEIVYN